MHSYLHQHNCKCSRIREILKTLKQRLNEKFKRRKIFVNELAVYEMALQDVRNELDS